MGMVVGTQGLTPDEAMTRLDALYVLHERGEFRPPRLSSLEAVLAFGIGLGRGRAFVDLWDVEKLFDCPRCGPARARRLGAMQRSPVVLPPIACDWGGASRAGPRARSPR